MPAHYLRIAGADAATSAAVRASLTALRGEMSIPSDFPAEVLADAERSAALDLVAEPSRTDHRAVPFVTIDPPGSMDLDQAVQIERAADGPGYLVRYAIADVAAFVTPGGPVDTEANARGTTLYGPDARTPLHPAVLSEGAASLLPDVDRPAVVWELTLDGRGELTDTRVGRGVVRSRARLSYEEAQAALDALDAGSPVPDAVARGGDTIALLRDVGSLRQQLERERGGVSLDVPEQVVVTRDDGTAELELRRTLPVEGWNAQVSLLTGIAAARLMRAGGVGILRTLPPADPRDLARLRRTAAALGIAWPDGTSYGELLSTLDSSQPRHAAFLNEATSLFRGASYRAFGDTATDPEPLDEALTVHAAIAAEYAHVTAPLRRLVDRYGTEACLAIAAGTPVPEWVLTALPGLPKAMARTGQRAGSFEKACLDAVEAAVVGHRVGEVFDGVIVDVADKRADDGTEKGQVVVADPALRAPVTGRDLPLGETAPVRLVEASVSARRVTFELAGQPKVKE